MNKRIKSLVLSAALVASMAILGGCGSNNVGYVDSVKVANSTEKGIEITKEINAKKAELDAKIAAADEASKQNVFNQANQELNAFANAKPSELSGGMRQRAALIRTLVLKPDIMLLDEPFSALDYQTRLNVSDDIGQIIKKEKKTAILVTHDLAEAISLADRILVLTSRPATIGQTVNVSFSDPGLSPLARRNAPEFKTYFNLIWKELNPDE